VTKAVNPMLSAGLLAEHGAVADQGIGRPRSIVQVDGTGACFLGVKLTADEAIAVAMDLSGAVVATRRAPLRSHRVGDAVSTIARVGAQLARAVGRAATDFDGLGISLSGDIDRAAGCVVFSPFLGWREVSLAELVEQRTGIRTTIENDVRALTFAEQWFGAAVGAESLALVTIGQGVGCGLFVGGRVLTGYRGVTGELGHSPLADPALECYCGAHGCVEAVAATPAILREASAVTRKQVTTLADAIAHATKNARVAEVFRTAGDVLGRAIAILVNLVGPERVVLSGEGLEAFELLEPALRTAFAEHAYKAAADTPIVVRPLPFEEWARGVATAALQDFLTRGGR
jgi:predicted NBD/HSP70 family sugar kinase